MDRLTEMEAFATVVDQGGFTDAAKKMGISKSAVSKHVSALEARLGARLLNRTTRRVSPTEIGLAYYDRARRVLNDAGEADALVTSMQCAPSGLLRVSVATDFGVNLLSPILGDFLLEYPDITVNMVLNNRYVELISEGFDLAIRVGELEDSSLRARKLTETTRRMIASPSYFQKHGRPLKIDDLNDHKLLHYSNQANGNVWKLTAPSGEKRQVRTAGWLTVNDGQSLLNAAVSGRGESQHRGHPCRLRDLEAAARAEAHRRAAIHHQVQQRLTFLAVDFQMGAAGARGGAPVHVADVVAGAVQARLLEVEPAPEPARRPVTGMVVVHFA